MRKGDIIRGIVLVIIILFFATNINGINSFLSVHSDKTIDFKIISHQFRRRNLNPWKKEDIKFLKLKIPLPAEYQFQNNISQILQEIQM